MKTTNTIPHNSTSMLLANSSNHSARTFMQRLGMLAILLVTFTLGARAQSGGTGVNATDPYLVESVAGLNYMAEHPTYHFKVMSDFDASEFAKSITNFSGTFDGNYKVIRGLRRPLFTSVNGGTIKNVVLDNVQLTSSETINNITCLGAIAAYAAGNTKIYNCGILSKEGISSVSGGNNTGSLVGYIVGNTRVVNNYSYANVSGGQYVGGIVGRVEGTALKKDNYSNNSNNNHCAVTNNMFYGDLRGTSNVSPVYAGKHTSNVQDVNEYNFWRSKANVSYNNYNDQLAVDKDAYLNRFPFYRHIQNTHRELAAIYLFGSRTDANVAEIGHWYNVKNDEKVPYPVIEEWQTNTKRTTVDIANNLPNTSEKFAGKLLSNIGADGYYTGTGQQVNSMGNGGYLNVTVKISNSTYTSQLPITDMDTLNYDFTWGKVVLPFANEYEGWTRNYEKICTGWKITSITGGTAGSLSNYNFADRDCTAKDLYSNSNYIFAQGGNYIVPYGVTAITIEANFANAYYLSDAYYDYGYDTSYGGQTNLTTKVPTTYHGQTVYTSLSTLIGNLSNSTDPHSQAIVLVGNYHYNQNTIGGVCFNTGKAVTIMSVDEDCNQEPDYGWYSYHTESRTKVPPVRFDFLPNIGIGMAARTTGSTPSPGISVWYGHGWFELTETCVSLMSECEIQSTNFTNGDNGKGNNRWIANSGYFIQIVRTRKANCTKLSYLQIGGNAYVEQLYPGSHTDASNTTTLCPINVTGGEIEECFMTGYKAGATATGSDIRFWCAGGKIHKYLSAYLENPSTNGVNVTATVDHARIGRFFGGGTSSSARITGNINVTMNNSLVDFYCGGPEFGDMTNGKTVTTNAIGSTFGEYYGAGFGGTSITYNRIDQKTVTFNADYTFPFDWNSSYDRLTSNNYGIGTCYDFEYILYAGGNGSGVARFYTGYAQFSLAQTGNVTNNLQHCTVKGDFYGGGCQGTVNGTVNSTLTNCTLYGNAFGGGYKAAANEVQVYPATQPTYSVYTKETGIFSDFGTVTPETYTWEYRATAGSDEKNKKLYTTTDMSQLGNVTGNISIDVKGGSVAKSVFGGGNESPSRKNTVVTIQENAGVGVNVYGGGNIAMIDGSSTVALTLGNVSGSVFGGGNEANIGTTSDVTVSGGTVTRGVYGGCNATGTIGTNATVKINGGVIGSSAIQANVHGGGYGQATIVSGNVDVTLGTAGQEADGVIIWGDVYGGSALGNVNGTSTSDNKHTYVTLNKGTINGSLYGGGLGQKNGINGATSDIASNVYGPVVVNMNGGVVKQTKTSGSGSVFGCNNINGAPQQTVVVNMNGTTADYVYGGGNLASYSAPNNNTNYPIVNMNAGLIRYALYGGGLGESAIVTGNPQVCMTDGTIGYTEETENNKIIVRGGDVFGGGNAAAVTGNTSVTITGGKVKHNVYGGGNQAAVSGTTNVKIGQ